MRGLTAVLGAALISAAVVVSPSAQATPGQCVQAGGWGGFCDSLPFTPDGVFQHCENAMGFSNCFLVRPVPVSVDPKGWVPA